MKTTIALGLAMLLLLPLGLLRRTHTNRHHGSEGEPATAESPPISRPAPARRAASQTLQATPFAQPIHALLLAAIEAESDSDRRSEALERVVESVSEAELPATLAALRLAANPGAADMSRLLVRRWAESDPVAAAAWVSQLPENPARRAAFEQVAIAWANTDLAAAAGWVQSLPEGESHQATTIALAYEAARNDPVAALDLTTQLSPTPTRDDFLVHAVSQWAAAEAATAATWAMQVADANLRERLVAAVAVAAAEQDGAAAAALAANGLGAGVEQDRATVSIVQRWVQSSPPAAAAWVAEFPDLPARQAAVQNLLALWTAQDAEAAGNWVNQLPVGSLRDLGVTAYVQALADQAQTSPVVETAGGI